MARDPDEPPKIHRVRRWFFAEGHEYYPDWRAKRAMRRAHDRTPETTIGTTKPGLCRIRGRARVLRSVTCDALGKEVGGFWARAMIAVRTFRIYQPADVTKSPIYDTWACGRIAVVDDTGVAIVSGDHVKLFRREGRAFMEPPFALAVTADAEVTVFGHAVRAPEADATMFAAPGSYRSAPEALVFEGTWLRPVVVLV